MAMSQAERDAQDAIYATYVATQKPIDDAKQALRESDKLMARAGEDLLALLESKGILSRTELPADTQAVIADREAKRAIITS